MKLKYWQFFAIQVFLFSFNFRYPTEESDSVHIEVPQKVQIEVPQGSVLGPLILTMAVSCEFSFLVDMCYTLHILRH